MDIIEKRKKEHIDIVKEQNIKHVRNYWDDFILIHNALPEINMDEIDTSVKFLNKKLNMPFLIAGMTGGFKMAGLINEELAEIAEKYGVGMGVGSQRMAIENGKYEETYSIINKYNVPLKIANIGAPQILQWKDYIEKSQMAIDMISADALAIHLNFLQEVIQPEGERMAKGCIERIKNIAESVSKPVIVKETGAGISREVAEKLIDTGIKAIDVGGAGGTSFSAVEAYRARKRNDKIQEELGKIFWNWGIPTPYSLIEIYDICRDAGVEIIATGGIRNGLDVAKAIALGASIAGAASIFLENGMEKMEIISRSFRAAMFLTGCKRVDELREVEIWSL